MKNEKRISKLISLLLRHKPEVKGLNIDKNGWVGVKSLTEAIEITKEELDFIVDNNDKQRFEYNLNHSKIRARQGHTLPITIPYKATRPPKVLYHGSASSKTMDIVCEGINKMERNHVHLSVDIDTALKVGRRHCKKGEEPVIFRIDADKMFEEGGEFYLSDNGVWLTDHVKSRYFELNL